MVPERAMGRMVRRSMSEAVLWSKRTDGRTLATGATLAAARIAWSSAATLDMAEKTEGAGAGVEAGFTNINLEAEAEAEAAGTSARRRRRRFHEGPRV